MRTSLRETQQIEEMLLNRGNLGERLLLEASAQLDESLADKIHWQKHTYALVRAYGRQQLRAEIKQVDARLFSGPQYRSFREKIYAIFNLR